MDLRFRPQARTTKDVDLSILIAPDAAGPTAPALREMLQAAADLDVGDYLTYRIGEPKRELTNAPKGNARYPCEAVLVGKVYARFQIDVGLGDASFGEPEELTGDGPARLRRHPAGAGARDPEAPAVRGEGACLHVPLIGAAEHPHQRSGGPDDPH